MSWEDTVDDVTEDWEAALGDDVPESWETEEQSLFEQPAIVDDRVVCPGCKGEGKVHPETAKRIEEGMKPQPKKEAPKTGRFAKSNIRDDRDRQVADLVADIPLDDPVAEKLRLQKIVEDSDKKIVDEMFGGEATEDFLSENEKAVKQMTFNSINDYNRIATLLGKRANEANNVVGTVELLSVLIRTVKDSLSSDDFVKLSSQCGVYKEERKKAEVIVPTKKSKKKKGVAAKINVDTWEDEVGEYHGNNDMYADDFM
ncbi:hypothetical protein WA158_000079 [Blastocystis sp. Blastoise]